MKINTLITSTIVLILVSTVSVKTYAEIIKIPVGSQADSEFAQQLPKKGMTKSQVEANYGAPQAILGPTGSPAIYRWEYSDFIVVFESDHVIHSVAKK